MTERPHLDGGSRRQARIVEVLWQQHLEDPHMLVSGAELARRTGLSKPSRDIAVVRVKIRRQGWDVESRNGRNGGFRLVQWKG